MNCDPSCGLMQRLWLLLVVCAACCRTGPVLAQAQDGVLQRPALMAPQSVRGALLAVALAGRRIVTVGERGIVLLSDDRGANWRQVPVPVSVSLTAVRFVNEKTGWQPVTVGWYWPQATGGRAGPVNSKEGLRPSSS